MRPPKRLWLPLVGYLIAAAACSDNPSTRVADDPVGGPNIAWRAGCIEELSPIADDVKLTAEMEIADLLDVARDEHTAPLRWPDGEATEITFAVREARAFKVTSREDPNDMTNRALRCEDRVVVNTSGRVSTADGKFEVDISEIQLEVMEGKWLVGSSGGLPKSMLRGSYADTAAPATGCLRDAVVRVSLSLTPEPRFRGELSNIVADVPCDRKGDPNEGITRRPGVTW